MSYKPVPPRVWTRVQKPCTKFNDPQINNIVYVPLTNKYITKEEALYEDKLFYKGNILQYKNNSAKISKKQKYSQICKGLGPNRTKNFATQSLTYTNPNTTNLLRVNSVTIPFPNDIVGSPNNISGPFQYGNTDPNNCNTTSLQDGGTLQNPCTNEIIKQPSTNSTQLFPNTCSDVPGKLQLLGWNNKLQTYYPRQNLTMNTSGNKWPEGYKGFVSATTCLTKK